MNRDAYTSLADKLLETLHENTKYGRFTLHRPQGSTDPVHIDPLPQEPLFALPRQEAHPALTMSLQDAIMQRQSVRNYRDEPMSQELLGHFLALCAAPELFPAEEAFCGEYHHPVRPWLHLYAFLWGVEGLPVGTYYYDPQRHGVVHLAPEPTRETISASIFQQEFRTGTGMLLLVGDLTAAVAAYGQRGYRYLLMQAGVVGESCYLAGSALGIGVSGNGGLREIPAQYYGGFDGIRRDLLWTLPFGLPGSGPSPFKHPSFST